jgi:hypothetical protein
MNKETISTIYSFIARIVSLLEEELDLLGTEKSKSKIMIKKHITDLLNKLVNLIVQLNKLHAEEKLKENLIMAEEDAAIIAEFLKRSLRKMEQK